MPQKPAPELKKLDFFAGEWKSEAVVYGAVRAPNSKYSSTSHAEWMEGGFFLIEHWDFEVDGVKGTELSLKGYDPVRKVYTYPAFTSHGEAFYDTGTVEGDTWTWLRNETKDGKTVKGRYTIQVTSQDSYTFRFETFSDGKSWTLAMAGTSARTRQQ